MSYVNSSLLLSSYDACDRSLSHRKRVSSDASSDSWVLDSTVSEELKRYGTSSPEYFSQHNDHYHFQRSISLDQLSWVHASLEDIPPQEMKNKPFVKVSDIAAKDYKTVQIPDVCDKKLHGAHSSTGNASDSVNYKSVPHSGGEKQERNKKPFSPITSVTSAKPKTNGQQIQVKTKIRSMWNNMKYGWRVKRDVNLKIDSPICLLGRYYHAKFLDISCDFAASKSIGDKLKVTEAKERCDKLKVTEAKERFKQDLRSRIWFTYRLNFPAIPGTDIVTDSGWGCMLRAGQMMMAQALMCHFLYRDWRLPPMTSEYSDETHRAIIRWFGDSLSPKCPFSIQHLVVLGQKYGRKVGDWYGPTHVAHVLRKALISGRRYTCKFNNLCMYVAPDGIIFKQDIVDLCSSSLELPSPTDADIPCASASQERLLSKDFNLVENSMYARRSLSKNVTTGWPYDSGEYFPSLIRHVSECKEASESLTSSLEPSVELQCDCPSVNVCTVIQEWKSLILFVSVRLGNEKVNRYYIPWLKSLLEYEHCVGIIGGRPKHAVYFVGWQDEKLIHLDPHFCQPLVDVEREDFSEKSFHCASVQAMPFADMDPSCSIGFYFKTKDDFDSFPKKIVEISPFEKNMDYPLFAFVEGRRADAEKADVMCDASFSVLSQSGKSFSKDDDEYILL